MYFKRLDYCKENAVEINGPTVQKLEICASYGNCLTQIDETNTKTTSLILEYAQS